MNESEEGREGEKKSKRLKKALSHDTNLSIFGRTKVKEN